MMLDDAAAAATVTLHDVAIDQEADARRACLTLIGAAMACQVALREYLSPGKVEDIVMVLSVAGSVLVDDKCGGLLDLVAPAGSA
jgi:hypothetical protein